MRVRPPRRHPRGFTLIEVILALVVVGICTSSLHLVAQTAMRMGSGLREQTQIAVLLQQFADEIAAKAYDVRTNPSLTPTPTGCSRRAFNDVRDYAGYASTGICDVWGNAVATLTDYAVAVTVTPSSWAGASDALLVTVQITGPSLTASVSTWRVGL